jgi:hypothetical protein
MSLELSGTTGVKGVAGSVSAPSIVGDDTNTGISFPAADTIKFSTGGVERMAITNSGISGISAGITMVDSWYVGAGLDPGAGANTITANWTRNTSTEVGSIGSAMTQSSGLFSFPSTGIYYMSINGGYYRSNTSEHNYLGFTIIATTNNGSSYYTANSVYNALPSQGGNTYSSMTTYFIFDCTDTSTHKVSFQTEADASGTTVIDVSGRRFNVIFIRLGDT